VHKKGGWEGFMWKGGPCTTPRGSEKKGGLPQERGSNYILFQGKKRGKGGGDPSFRRGERVPTSREPLQLPRGRRKKKKRGRFHREEERRV